MQGLFKNKNFILLISGKTISLMGTAIFEIALMWHFLSEYPAESGALLAWVMILGTIPAALLGSVIGMLSDRVNKKTLMAVSDMVSGAAIAAITIPMYFMHVPSPVMLAGVGLLAVTASCISISVNSMIPELFESKLLYQANALNQLTERGTLLAGFALGGTLVAFAGVKTVFLINAASYFISAAFTLFIRYKPAPRHIHFKAGIHMVSDLKTVFAFLKKNKNLLILTLMFTGVNFFWDPLGNIVLPYVVKNDLQVMAWQFGLIQAALPAGFCVGALLFTQKPKWLQKKRIVFYAMLAANTAFAILSAFIVMGGSIQTAAIYVTIGMLAVGGVCSAALNISTAATIQARVPDELRGKYYGFARSLSSGLVPLGSMVMGLMIGAVDKMWLLAIPLAMVFILLASVPRRKYQVDMPPEDIQNAIDSTGAESTFQA